jgi:hypothetical protein
MLGQISATSGAKEMKNPDAMRAAATALPV